MLHQRVLGVVRLLGPRHWASWRLLLLGVELHCGAMEEAMMKVQVCVSVYVVRVKERAARSAGGLVSICYCHSAMRADSLQ